MRRIGFAGLHAIAALAAIALVGCKGPMAKIDAVREALEKDDAAAIVRAVDGYPACEDAPPVALLKKQPSPRDTGCFAAIATALGSKSGFNARPADQTAATTVAIVLLRDGRGDWVAHSDDWLGVLRSGKGSGTDALRLAVAHGMAEAAVYVGRRLEDDKDAQSAMKAVAGAVPGACPTYWLLGSGAALSSLAVEHSADHAACVHHDLARREGPGGSYGSGMFRALEGSLALWREAERALRQGLPSMGGAAKVTVEAKLKTIETATLAIATKKLADAGPESTLTMLGEMHADAGVAVWKGADGGGADGGGAVDAGAAPKK
jgi:hypothetical protein